MTFFISLVVTLVQWLGSVTILSVPVIWIRGAVFVMGVFLRAFLYKP